MSEHHTGPISKPAQLFWVSFLSFIVPVLIIVALVNYVASEPKPAAGAVNQEKALAQRLQRVGSVEIRDANRPLREGAEVFKNQCAACHTAGVAGAPKFADKAAWASRITQGYDALLNAALKGKNAMGPQGGGEYNDFEIGRAVVYMANEVGANFPVPEKPAQ
jgi:cytochrome c5